MDNMAVSNKAFNASECPVAPTIQLPTNYSSFKPATVAMKTTSCQNELQATPNDHLILRTTSSISPSNIMVGSVSLKLVLPTSSSLAGDALHSLHLGHDLSGPAGHDLSQRGSPVLRSKCLINDNASDFQPLLLGGANPCSHLGANDSDQPDSPLLPLYKSNSIIPGPSFCQFLWGQPVFSCSSFFIVSAFQHSLPGAARNTTRKY